MSTYKIGVQKTPTGQFRVVLYSVDNGKLVLSGEPLKNRRDADDIAMFMVSQGIEYILRLIPASKKWPKNSGPKKKAVKSTSKRK